MSYINDISVAAPVWNKADPRELLEIIEHLSEASYHYADDSGREWGSARDRLNSAASQINNLGLRYNAISHLVRHKQQLVTLDQVFDAVLNDARAKGGTQ